MARVPGLDGEEGAAARAQALGEGIKASTSLTNINLNLYATQIQDEGAKARPIARRALAPPIVFLAIMVEAVVVAVKVVAVVGRASIM